MSRLNSIQSLYFRYIDLFQIYQLYKNADGNSSRKHAYIIFTSLNPTFI